jgi:hypothetical protein
MLSSYAPYVKTDPLCLKRNETCLSSITPYLCIASIIDGPDIEEDGESPSIPSACESPSCSSIAKNLKSLTHTLDWVSGVSSSSVVAFDTLSTHTWSATVIPVSFAEPYYQRVTFLLSYTKSGLFGILNDCLLAMVRVVNLVRAFRAIRLTHSKPSRPSVEYNICLSLLCPEIQRARVWNTIEVLSQVLQVVLPIY